MNRSHMMNHFQKKMARPNRRGSVLKTLLVLLTVAAVLIGGSWYGWSLYSKKQSSSANVILAKVTRGTFLHEVTGKGNAESAKNIDITCQVESAQGTTVIWIIPEGEMVAEGDELVLLDSSDLEDKVNTQQITCNTNAATVASSQASLRTAELSLEEYIEGTFEENWMTIENSIYEAQENQKQQADTVRYTERLVQFGYQTVSQLEAEQVAAQKYLNTVQSNLLQQIVLLRYTSEKQITQLMANIETARAKLNSDTYTNELAKNRLEHYTQQLENCTIKAPQAGQVVYANQDSRRWTSESDMIKEGSTVRERQVLIRLPDPNQMQVKTMINEANIAYVKNGMKAKIAFDALSNRTFDGTVVKVNQYPEISWMSSAKDYVTIVKIDNSVPEIRSGLTAEVKIVSQKIDNVLMLPVQCIVEVNNRSYVVQHIEKQWLCKEVKIGLSNDKQVIIEGGIEEGETVVSGARQYKDKVSFPAADTPSLFADAQSNRVDVADTDKSRPDDESPSVEKPAEGAEKEPADVSEKGSMPEGGPPTAGGHGGGPGGPGAMPFANLMTDGKLEISKLPEQLPQQVRDQIAKADKNSDGFLDADELKAIPTPGGPRKDRQPRKDRRDESMPPDGMSDAEPVAGDFSPSGDEQAQTPNDTTSESVKKPNSAELERLNSLESYYDLTAMELCQRADKNSDKIITREELGEAFPEMVPFFDEWDRGGDDQLSRTDLVIGFCTVRINWQKMTAVVQAAEEAAVEETGKEPSGIQELIGKEPEELFTLLDGNKDGFLSSDEMSGEKAELYRNLLTKMDTDEDGKLGREEFIKGIKRMRMMMGQGGGSAAGGPGGGGSPPPPK